jgi:hypothetical protein
VMVVEGVHRQLPLVRASRICYPPLLAMPSPRTKGKALG